MGFFSLFLFVIGYLPTYCFFPLEIHTSYPKRALSCEPEQGTAAKKKTTFDVKQQGKIVKNSRSRKSNTKIYFFI